MKHISLAATIAGLIQQAQVVISILINVKANPKEVRTFILEISSIAGLLQWLLSLGKERQAESGWPTSWAPLFSQGGTIEQFQIALTQLTRKVSPIRDSYGTAKQIAWSMTQRDTEHILAVLERVISNIILALSGDSLDLNQAIAGEEEIRGCVQEVFIDSTKGARDIELREVLDWLSPLDSWINQQDMLSIREENTGLWFLQNPTFESWVGNDFPILWCPGIPGSGKTVITSIVIDYLSKLFQGGEFGIAFIYCSYRQHFEQNLVNIVGGLLKTLVLKKYQNDGVIADEVLELYSQNKSRHKLPSLGDLAAILSKQVSAHNRTFIIIDALDECSEGDGTREQLLQVLRGLITHDKKTSIFVTSRHIQGIGVAFEECAKLEIAADPNDIRRYIQYRIQQHSNLPRFIQADRQLQERIMEFLISSAQGMFLLARLQMDTICRSSTRKALLLSLQRIPSTLEGVYSELMRRIEENTPDDFRLAIQVLSWVFYANRPLTIKELQCALALQQGDNEIDSELLVDESIMLDVCGALVTVEQASNTIRLVHYTAKEYLERMRGHLFPSAQISITTQCLTCLSLAAPRAGPCTSDIELECRLASIPLLQYAAKHWGAHMRQSELAEINMAAMELLQNEKLLASTIQIMHLSSVRYPNYSQMYPQKVSGLHIAAYLDLKDLVRYLLAYGVDIEEENEYYGHPLQAAAAGGSLNVCRLLVEAGADVNARGGKFNTALQAAAFAGHAEAVTLFLENGADFNVYDGLYAHPLQAASIEGHVIIVKDLLGAGAVVNRLGTGGRTALHCAAMHGHFDITKLLLANGAEADSRDKEHGRTALCWAAWNGHDEIIQILLEYNASINAVDHQNSTALHLALERHHQYTVQFLLESNADFDVVANASNRTQVQIALASIEKINPIEFELDESLSKTLERGSQADVRVFRRKLDFNHKIQFEQVIRKEFSTGNEYAADIQRNLLRERQTLQNLNHPNVVKYLKYEEDDNHEKAFLYTEYCEGGSLGKYVHTRKNARALDLYGAWNIIYDLAAALAYCHHGLQMDETGSFSLKHSWQTIIHRDIKPANVVLSNIGGRRPGVPIVKLCDMGWAKVWDDLTGFQTAHVGSRRYMPKEVKDKDDWTPKGDIYSLGATLHDLKKDFEDHEFEDMISCCIEDDPFKRPSSLTLLEIAAKRLAEITRQPFLTNLLPNNYGESNYLFQAVLETMDHFFNIYLAVRVHRVRKVAMRLKLLINDWHKGETDLFQALHLWESPHLALIIGDLERAKNLIRTGHVDSARHRETCGFTPLHIACREAYDDVVECWIEKHHPLDGKDDKGRTALHWAVLANSLPLCEMLLRATADTDLCDDEGSTALHKAADSGNTGILLALLDNGASIEAKDKENATALHRAAASGKESAVRLLLQRLADPTAVDKEGFTPEQSAITNGFRALKECFRTEPKTAQA